MRILFVGGGSIGHIAPSVAVWRAIQELEPKAECHFLCSDRKEEMEFLQKEKLPSSLLGKRKLSPMQPVAAVHAFRKAKIIIDAWKPDVVFSKGGSLGIPVAWTAKRKGIPVVLHESDAVMGRANKLISRWAKVICLGFPDLVSSFGLRVTREDDPTDSKLETRNSKPIFTGNPIRPEVTEGSREEGLKLTKLTGEKPILLVLGGSQGATALNDAIKLHLEELLKHVEIAHLTGKGKAGAGNRKGYWSRDFAQRELADLYAIADLALSRSGAGSIGELSACGIPSILVPLRGLAQDHQLKNAEIAQRNGGCILLHQDMLTEALVAEIASLAKDSSRRSEMGKAIRALHAGTAAKKIAKILLREAGKQ